MTVIPSSVTNKTFCVLQSIALLRVIYCRQQNQTTAVSTEMDSPLLSELTEFLKNPEFLKSQSKSWTSTQKQCQQGNI